MGYRLNRLDEPVFIAVSKPLLTDFGIHRGLESCDGSIKIGTMFPKIVFQKRSRLPSINYGTLGPSL